MIKIFFIFPILLFANYPKLQLNGSGIREATVFNIDVYKASLYLPRKSKNVTEIASMFPKRVTMRFLRDIPYDKFEESIVKSFKKHSMYNEDSKKLLKSWKKVVSKINEGTILDLLVGKNSISITNGKQKSTFVSDQLAKDFHLLWLGSKSNLSMKNGLLGIDRN